MLTRHIKDYIEAVRARYGRCEDSCICNVCSTEKACLVEIQRLEEKEKKEPTVCFDKDGIGRGKNWPEEKLESDFICPVCGSLHFKKHLKGGFGTVRETREVLGYQCTQCTVRFEDPKAFTLVKPQATKKFGEGS